MARYDRIAPLTAPSRDAVFPAWLVLRDLEGRDRDADLARRARLRYLAIRPVVRLLHRGVSAVNVDSYIAEIEVAREDLGYLPARDAERARLARFLHQIEQREPSSLITALLEIADACALAGHTFGAEEYALTAHGLAVASAEYRSQGQALAVRSRVYRLRGQSDDALSCAQKAESIAVRIANHEDLVRARAEIALNAAARGNGESARETLHNTLAEMRNARDVNAELLTEAKLCAVEVALGNPAAALEHGGRALRAVDDARERIALLEDLGSAFAAAGLHKVAERCYAIIAQRGADPVLRAKARAARAAQTAAAGNSNDFRDQRTALLSDAGDWSADPRATCMIQLALGRGCMLVQAVDFARDHLRAAIATARKHDLADMLNQAEIVLAALETDSTSSIAPVSAPSIALARSIAEQLESLPDFTAVPA